MRNVTTALWIVRDLAAQHDDEPALAAIGRISEELARLREANWANLADSQRYRAERDEAVAALRLTMDFIAENHLRGPEYDTPTPEGRSV